MTDRHDAPPAPPTGGGGMMTASDTLDAHQQLRLDCLRIVARSLNPADRLDPRACADDLVGYVLSGTTGTDGDHGAAAHPDEASAAHAAHAGRLDTLQMRVGMLEAFTITEQRVREIILEENAVANDLAAEATLRALGEPEMRRPLL